MNDTPVPSSPEHRMTVRDNPDGGRYELVDDGAVVGIADYRVDGTRAIMPHTVIDPGRRGQGLGDVLLEGALADLTRRGLTVVPQCWFVADYLERHPDAAQVA